MSHVFINLFVANVCNGYRSTDDSLTYKNNQSIIAKIVSARKIESWIFSGGGCGRNCVGNFVRDRGLDSLWVIDERA